MDFGLRRRLLRRSGWTEQRPSLTTIRLQTTYNSSSPFLLLLLLVTTATRISAETVATTCRQKCYSSECSLGCNAWRSALLSNCRQACSQSAENAAQESQTLRACTTGCDLAVEIYTQRVDEFMRNQFGPSLAAHSKTNQSLILQWLPSPAAAHDVANLTYSIQRLTVGLEDDWQFHDDVRWLSRQRVRISGLRPYVTYKFRVAVNVALNVTSCSPDSVPITTEPFGVPQEAPDIISTSATSTSVYLRWTAPFFVGAPLIGYRLSVTAVDTSDGRPAGARGGGDGRRTERVMEVLVSSTAPEQVISEVVTLLRPDTDYAVNVAALNQFGAGVPATVAVRTLPHHVDNDARTHLLVGVDNKLLLQDLVDVFQEPQVLYEDNNKSVAVTAVAVHWRRQLVYFSTSRDQVHQISLNVTGQYGAAAVGAARRRARTPAVTQAAAPGAKVVYQAGSGPSGAGLRLSVDWLYDRLYVADQSTIFQCDLDAVRCRSAVSLPSLPHDLHVNPYSGYLFWSVDSAIYRSELQVDGSVDQATGRRLVVSGVDVAPFVVDYANYRLLYPTAGHGHGGPGLGGPGRGRPALGGPGRGGVVVSAALDGSDAFVVRNDTATGDLVHVSCFTYHEPDDVFYWATNDGQLLTEELNKESGVVHHNELLIEGTRFAGITVWHPASQPTPLPLSAPTRLQALMSVDSAAVSWQKPLSDQGRGAWQDWSYEVEVEVEVVNSRTNTTSTLRRERGTSMTVNGLLRGCVYHVRVRASSTEGSGPWSTDFTTQTLPAESDMPHVFYVDNGLLFKMTVNQSVVQLVADVTPAAATVTEMSIFADDFIVASNNGTVYLTHQGQSMTSLTGIHDVGVLGFDWLTDTLYWTNNKLNIIQRLLLSRVRAGEVDMVEIVHRSSRPVLDVVVDAVRGYIYWTTASTVELARLSGHSHSVIFRLPNFSGRYILGLAMTRVSLGCPRLYWFVKESNIHLSLYATEPGNATWFNADRSQQLCYIQAHAAIPSLEAYGGKVFWISASDVISVVDVSGCSVADMRTSTAASSLLSAFSVNYSTKYQYPENFNKSSTAVIPQAVDVDSSLRVTGKADNWSMQWAPVTVQQRSVYYQATLQWGDSARLHRRTDGPSLVAVRGIKPYSLVEFTVKACTYWGCSEPTRKTFRSPMGVPSAPRRLRAFVTSRGGDDVTRQVRVDLRWSPPHEPGGIISSYHVLMATRRIGDDSWNVTTLAGDQLATRSSVVNAPINTILYFKVTACTQVGCSPVTDVVSVNTSVERPLPRLLTSANDSVHVLLPDDGRSFELIRHASIVSLCYIAADDSFYWIDRARRLVAANVASNGTVLQETLVEMAGRGRSVTADWVGRSLYWLEQSDERRQVNAIMKYDLHRGSDTSTSVVLQRPMSTKFGSIQVYPSRRLLYWTESQSDDKGSLMQCRLDGSDLKPVLRRRQQGSRRLRSVSTRKSSLCDCPAFSVASSFAVDYTQPVSQLQVYVADSETGDIWSVDEEGCHCRLIVNATALSLTPSDMGLPPNSLTVDGDRLYWMSDTMTFINSVNKHTGLDLVSDAAGAANILLAFGDNLQPFPDIDCVKVSRYDSQTRLVSNTNSSLRLHVSPWQPPSGCADTSFPSVKYTIHYRAVNAADSDVVCTHPQAACSHQESFETDVTVTSLEPYMLYTVQVEASNFYSDSPTPLLPSNVEYFMTKPGTPSAPLNVAAEAYSPSVVRVTWRPPAQPHGPLTDIVYVVSWHAFNADGSRTEGRVETGSRSHRLTSRSLQGPGDDLQHVFMSDLQSSRTYNVRVLAYDAEMSWYSASETVSATTFQRPHDVELLAATSSSIYVAWVSSPDDSVLQHTFEYAKVGGRLEWKSAGRTLNTTNSTLYEQFIEHLRPRTGYAVRISLVYRSLLRSVWPSSIQHTFFTSADVPLKPDKTWMSEGADGIVTVRWKAPYDGGSPILQYLLVVSLEASTNWTTIFNGSDTEWIVSDDELNYHEAYVFKVSARNAIGWGPFSNDSLPFVYTPRSLESSDHITLALASTLSIFLMLLAVFICIVVHLCRQRAKHKHLLPMVPGVIRRAADHELATLRELPSFTVQTTNALYAQNAVTLTLEDVASLKHFTRDQIKLTMFLGSGAFGEVFEGVATNILSENSGCTKVAVKTLHKNASEGEKDEFLQEALLMSNFKHEHILQLLGVCLDNDPQFMILELMEGGDLLSYLRASRPSVTSGHRLFLPDMVGICLDVGKGCEYLEDLHFVHRDLAARNCLISLTDRGHIVKIGDFGLARDIYKNDYYRKEGEGLLPVRWMSPESLIDGVFTIQSDVWAFGVLMWEVLTLGQQPYPARTNTEVLQFVRSGGRLDRPDTCPDEMYHLMLKCWLYVPHARPSFKYLVQQLSVFARRSTDPLDVFSGQRHTTATGRRSLSRSTATNNQQESPARGSIPSNNSDSRTVPNQESHLARDSMTSLPAANGRHSQSLVDHSRSRSTSSSGDDHNFHRTSGYLQPLVSSASGTAGHPIKYLQLLNTSTASSTPQLAAVRRPAAVSRDRDDRRRRPDYSPLVCDGNDSSGTSLAAQHAEQLSPCSPLRPGPSPIYGRHATTERRVQSMSCDDTG